MANVGLCMLISNYFRLYLWIILNLITMKKILGLDLGSTSIGWAVIEENSEEVVDENVPSAADRIVAMGCRIVPLTTNESTDFSKGNALTKNSDRTARRTARKGYDRYQLRRGLLVDELRKLGMSGCKTLSTLELWGVRARAAEEQVSLPELGRVLLHINQKRGYRTVKSDFGDKAQGEYVAAVVGRYRELKEVKMTIGQYLYNHLREDASFRCKERVYPRDAYVEEYDTIMSCQQQYYPEVLTDEVVEYIRNYIIFHQRPLKSCKHLVARCELESRMVERDGRERNCGPMVAPRSSPLFQVCKLWECVNNITIRNKRNEVLPIDPEQRGEIFRFMNVNEKLKVADLKRLLGVSSREWQFGKSVGTGLQGNTTYCAIAKALGGKYKELLRFDLTEVETVDADGVVTQAIDASFEHEPLYKLWHVLYSISDIEELRRVLTAKFNITDEEVVENLCSLDFVKSGYGNKSSRAMRKILPYLQKGMTYYDAKMAAGYKDTSLTKEENESRVLADALKPIQRGELRQPVVEKILNQLVNLVNALMDEHGHFDEIRVELARELKQSREERKSATDSINQNQKDNEKVASLIEEYGLTPTRSRIQKYKLWREADKQCVYCGRQINVKEFLLGVGSEVEHIIPRSVLFDDSYTNKVCACRNCNKAKNNQTAYDFIQSRGEAEFSAYIERINDLAERKQISKSKLNKLLMPMTKLPDDFINRQLVESQYIAKAAREILKTVCYNVYATSGSITDFIRHQWGWDQVLHDLNFNRYRDAGLTDYVERDGEQTSTERIVNWTKRMDHRHHAVDALVIACTKQGFIQRINNLNSLKGVAFRQMSSGEQDSATRHRLTRLERYIGMQPHFTTAEVAAAVEQIAISLKSGKRVASPGKRYIYKGGKRICMQAGVVVPRGALSEESVYGRICDSATGQHEMVIKYKLEQITPKDVSSIVDKRIREIVAERFKQCDGNVKKAFAEPLLDHQGRAIRSIRCKTGLSAVVPLRVNEQGEAIAFVKPGNNHHVAIYEDENGKLQEHIATFWHAVERKKYGLPVIITDPAAAWDAVTDKMPESFLRQLPPSAKWKFKYSMQQNEMFVMGMDEESYRYAMDNGDYALLCKYLYRVQKLTHNNYYFRHHIETTVDDKYGDVKNMKLSMQMGKLILVTSLKSLEAKSPHKVRVSVTGKISEI